MKDRDKPRDELLAELVKLRQKVKELEESRVLLKNNERSVQAANALLRLYARAVTRREYLGVAVKLTGIWSDCRYVGIRILNHKGEIPYESYLGFSRQFWEAENWLSIHTDQCACVRVFTGKPEVQDISVMTPGGSFYLDNSVKFLQSLPEEQRARFRGVCVKCGFKSIAIIPIGVQGKIIGVIHIADKRGGKVTLPLVEFLELMAFHMGQAMQKFSGEKKDGWPEAQVRLLMESSQDVVSFISLQGKYLSMNTAGCLLNRVEDPAALIGQSLSANIVDNQKGVEEAVRRAAAGEEVSLQYKSVDRSGREIWWESRFTPFRRIDGSIHSILSISKDISARQGAK